MPNPGHPTIREQDSRCEGRAAPPSPTNDRQSKGPEQEKRKGTNRLERPYQRPARGPREGRSPNSNRNGGAATTAGARAHKAHNEHRACTERTTKPSSRNAQTTWNGVPAGEDKGHPDGATRYKHRDGREGGTAGGRGATRSCSGTALPTCRECRAHINRALHLPRQ